MDAWTEQHDRMSKRIDYDQHTLDTVFRTYRGDFEDVTKAVYNKWAVNGILKTEDLYKTLNTMEATAFKNEISGWIASGKYADDKQFIARLNRLLITPNPRRVTVFETYIRKVTSEIKIAQKPYMLKSLYQTWLDSEKTVARILNASFTVAGDDVIYKAISQPFHGHNLFTRMWNQATDMMDRFMTLIKQALAKGSYLTSLKPIVKYFFSSGDYRARASLITESARINSEAKLSGYEKAGVKYYQFIAVMDSRTTDICIRHDRKVYKVKDMKIGVNANPMHINCRSTTRAYFIDDRTT